MRRSSLKAIVFVLAFIIMAIVGLVFGRILAGGDPAFRGDLYYPIN